MQDYTLSMFRCEKEAVIAMNAYWTIIGHASDNRSVPTQPRGCG